MHNVPLKALGIYVGDLFGFSVGNLYDKMTNQVKSTSACFFKLWKFQKSITEVYGEHRFL